MAILKNRTRRDQKFRYSESTTGISPVFLPFRKKQRNYEKQPFDRMRRERFYSSPLIEATICGFLIGEAIFGKVYTRLRGPSRRGTVKAGQVVAFPPTPATRGVERHFALSGRGNSGEDVGAAAGRA
jgi:hypothetical protein